MLSHPVNTTHRIALAAVASLFISACGDDATMMTPNPDPPSASDIIVSVQWLNERAGDPDVQLIDTRLTGYTVGHIPGAVPLLPAEIAATIDGIATQIVPAVDAQPVFRAIGLRNTSTIVVYGQAPEYDPARVVWALRYYMHQDVRYLDGGYAAWLADGGTPETGDASVTTSDYTIPGVDDSLRVTGDFVLSAIGDEPYDMPTIQLVDARSDNEYADSHIPSALHARWTRNLTNEFIKSEADVTAIYPGLDTTAPTVTYCLAGWRASVAWLALTWLGYEDVSVYDGSWFEWGSDPMKFPVTVP